MKKPNRINSGFTLMEIVIVLVIVGIVVAIVLPNLISNIAKSRAEEALAAISSYRQTVENCILKQVGQTDNNCNSALLAPPVSSANFTYALTAPANAADTGYQITATGQGLLANTDRITVTRAAAVWPQFGVVTCAGTNALAGMC